MKRTILLLSLLLSTALYAADRPYTRNVAIVIYQGVEVLDFTGPTQVFASAAQFGAKGQEKAFNVYTVAKTKDPIVSHDFLNVVPNYGIADAPKPDIIVLPGGSSDNVIKDAEWMAWVKSSAEGAENVLTVCTGAFIAGKIGLLDGLDTTTWYNAVPGLAREFPNTHVIPGRRYIDSGKIITTAGVSAGIDGSLHYVARTLGRYVADRTAEYMEYKWSPESYQTAKYAQLNPRLDAHGRALQQAAISTREGNEEEAVAAYRALIAQNQKDADAWLALGRILHNQKKYAEAMAAHEQAAKSPAQRGEASYNLACEYALTGAREKALTAAATALESGFRIRWYFENDADLASIREEPRFKALVAGIR